MSDVLAIAVHPDDETLGCGGALLKHASAGDSIHWLIVTAAHEPLYSRDYINRQSAQIEAVTRAYGFKSVSNLGLPTTRLETLELNSVINAVRKAVSDIRPEVVYAPNRSDAHSDHRVVFSALQSVLKPFHMGGLGVRRVLSCEVLSETDAAPALHEGAFVPSVFVDVTSTFERKLEIMGIYATEVQAEPLPRSLSAVRAQGRLRGASAGVEYAEAFMLLRELS